MIKRPVLGSCEISKKAASPIVAVNVAKTDPKLKLPLTYRVIMIIAPPQPGSAPKNDANKICQFPAFANFSDASIFRIFFNCKKRNNVAAYKG